MRKPPRESFHEWNEMNSEHGRNVFGLYMCPFSLAMIEPLRNAQLTKPLFGFVTIAGA
ncbi:hypothetical protein BRCON_1839 [Candidatus Sumerlaea chitinivorans]|jgi:hypothetical protein|uniref:Uncharacterized protein n=1 Tax=Sumerlaea chitinivorans TaxID=2250252 RepID=A0A2Z4Y6K1_SUMC1|nr:hypothetical protein BRCON_1839 [Candidatus Sumerlaea chitinivorans]